MDALQKFNVTFAEFIEDLVKVIQDDPELRVYEILLRGAFATNPRYVCDAFHKFVVIPYEDEILKKNEDFFLKHDYNNLTEADSNALEVITRIKTYWKDLNDANKETVWKYFRVLVLLNKRIVVVN